MTFGGAISGTGTLTQIGTGTLTLTGINSHTGGTTVSAGTLAISSDLNLGAASGPLTLDGGRLLTNAAISSARPITLARRRRDDRQWRLRRPVLRSDHRPRRPDRDRRRER